MLSRLLDLPAQPVDFARGLLSRFDLQLACLTRAERGCLMAGASGEVVDAAGVAVQVVDTVGSGDAFSAALIAAYLRGWPLERMATFANAVGALVASHAGAMPPLREAYADLVGRFSM